MRTIAVLVFCASAAAAHSYAQTPDDPTERPRIQVGPLGLTPSVALTNLGIDTNVFNEFEDPRRDFTFTVSPQIDARLRAGRSRLHVAARSDLVYFQQYSTERSLDGAVDSRFDVRGARWTPWIAGGYASGRQRFGYEIDLRARRVTKDVAAGVEARIAGRTRIGVSAQRTTYRHDADAFFLGSSLREVLDRRSSAIGLQVRHALTPLTTFVVSGQRVYDRFEFSPSRDADSVRVEGGFDLSPFALIAGRGRIGYRAFDGVHGGLPAYSGLVAEVAASSVIKGRTRLEVTSARDVSYSWELAYPYFVITGATLNVTPRLTPRWDVQGRLGIQRLAYRAAEGVPNLLANRVDRIGVVGAGIGYHLGPDVRIGVNVERERRESPVRRRHYEGYRTGVSVTYGR